MEKITPILKKYWKLIALVIIVLYLYSSVKGKYNNMVTQGEAIEGQWSQVTTEYQRRLDLIPNLVSTVKGYANHEKETLQALVEARAKATSVKIDPSNLSSEQIAKFDKIQRGVGSALSKLLVSVERYPNLKANQNFIALQNQLEETENRITYQRKLFNDKVKIFNTLIKKFPNNMYANMFGFEKKTYFEAEKGAEKSPKIKF